MFECAESHGIVTITFAHGKASALDLEFLRALTDALEGEPVVRSRAVVLTGTGRIFSAGVDLRRVLEGRSYLADFLPALDRFLLVLFGLDLPVVAAINGHAIAGGCVIACAADRRIMAEGGATIGTPELAVGVPFPPAALEIMGTALAPSALREVILTGRLYGPEAAERIGLVDERVAADELASKAGAVADEFAAMPGVSFGASKRQMLAAARERARVDASARMLEFWSSPEVQSHVAAYVEKTLGGR